VTSRALLRITGEREYAVAPLSAVEAVSLFRERAAVSTPDAAVGEICRRLDGLPLAIELAAARTRVLPPAMLLERLERRLPVLSGGARDAPERQRTLRATIEWSYELLSPDEKRLFARLAVFAGSFTTEAAEQVCDADLDVLQSLVEQSLVRREGERLALLETIREYALEQLEGSGEIHKISHEHAAWILAVGLPFEQDPGSPRLLSALPQLRAEIDNARAAVAWALEHTETDFVLQLPNCHADGGLRSEYAFGCSLHAA
jgi:predicted ATPase